MDLGAFLETAMNTLEGSILRILAFRGVLAELSTMTRIGLFPLTYLTVSSGLSISSVRIPIITASDRLRSLCKALRSVFDEIRESPDLVAIFPSKLIAATRTTSGLALVSDFK